MTTRPHIAIALLLTAGLWFLAVDAADLQPSQKYWESFAPLCGGYPSKENCDDGDTMLFNGLLCAAGDDRGCVAVRDAQDDEGRWWRSPRRKGGNLGKDNSFCRDMALGVLLYLTKSKNTSAAAKCLG